eukprot:3353679-Prymnesium_polylepis.1
MERGCGRVFEGGARLCLPREEELAEDGGVPATLGRGGHIRQHGPFWGGWARLDRMRHREGGPYEGGAGHIRRERVPRRAAAYRPLSQLRAAMRLEHALPDLGLKAVSQKEASHVRAAVVLPGRPLRTDASAGS